MDPLKLRVRVTNIRPDGFSAVVEFAPVLSYVEGKGYTKRVKGKDGKETLVDELPKAHGGHDIHRDHRWTVTFPVAAEGLVPGKESYQEEVEEVGPGEILRKVIKTKSRPAMVKGLIIDEAMTRRVGGLHPGMEYDVVGEPSPDSTFTPVDHAAEAAGK